VRGCAKSYSIRNSDGKLRAATWKLWTPSKKSDVYLACRALGGELKSSLHESGQWHVSYTQKFFQDKLTGRRQNRFVQAWPRPTPIIAGVTLAYRIVTPYSAVTSQITAADKNVMWLPNCPSNRATEIDVFIISSTSVVGWPGKNMGTKLIGSYNLPNDESVFAVHWVIGMPDLSNAFGTKRPRFQYYKGKTKEDLKSGNFRAIAFADHSDGSRVIYDFAVKGHKGLAQ
jgi:hypothetical protein